MTTTHKPATRFPWKAADTKVRTSEEVYVAEACYSEDAAYIAHAANAYPKLVEALRTLARQVDEYADEGNVALNQAWFAAMDSLRELGESE